MTEGDEILNTMESLRDDGWIIVLKVLPREMAYVIEGSRSEFDHPHPDKHVGKGKWYVEASDGWYLAGKDGHRMHGGGFVMADTPIEAIRQCYFRIQAEANERKKP